MFRPGLLPALALLAGASLSARAEDLVMIAPYNHAMPLAQYHNEKLTGGILKEVGDALAQRLGRRAVYVTVAGSDVSTALVQGKADGLCYVRPMWIDGEFDWTGPVMADTELIAAREGAPPIRSLLDLRDRPVGTVTGYRYPRIEQVLGLRFQRIDSVTMEENLRKVNSGAVRYTVLGSITLAYQQRMNKQVKLRSDLVFSSFQAQCAFSKRSNVPFADVNQAVQGMVDDGSVEDIMRRYR